MTVDSHIGTGSTYLGSERCSFCVWAPSARSIEVHLVAPDDRIVPLSKGPRGFHVGTLTGTRPGSLYFYRLDGQVERPDPASRFQPKGVHGPSQVVDTRFPWRDHAWAGLSLSKYLLYELHVGTFTPEGTFDALTAYLDYFEELGITALELMPVAQFPGKRNWGYDGVYPYAVQNSYGGTDALKRLVDACHSRGIAVVLDVVYNHMGPEGNYLWDFGPYFTDRYRTPWGPAINLDGPYSDEVRRFFLENALYWVTDFHIDALRIDAIHGICDFSARHFLKELATTVHEQGERLNRRIYVIPESDLNDSRVIRSHDVGGYGLDAQWNDDFHHALHALLTHERDGYYADFGELRHLTTALRNGFVYAGDYSVYRKRRHGNSSADLPARQFVVFSQNHDQVGNRALGDRLTQTMALDGLKLAAAVVILAPFIPLLFMGEEYGETAPFPYFVSHEDPGLVEAVRQSRREEFQGFLWSQEMPDPHDESTFLKATLDHGLRDTGYHRALYNFYRTLIALRKECEAFCHCSKENMEVLELQRENVLLIRRWNRSQEAAIVCHFGEIDTSVPLPLSEGRWLKLLDSAEHRWDGPGSTVPRELDSNGEISVFLTAHAVLVLVKSEEV
ncbi:MAG: malto-oligosyltrehalose trehalohydrolase [Desulfomonile tiedjei]|nr:malto-oligosyltrehalose trehalohydrolase [Desulfomonile tiedjei]